MMPHKVFLIRIFAILLILTACTHQQATVPASPTATSIPPSLTPTSIPLSPTPTDIPSEQIANLEAKLAELAEQGHISGSVLVGRQGKVLLSQGYMFADRSKKLPNTPKTRFRIGSITKQFTAMAILILENQQKLTVQDPICNYFSDCPTAWQGITIEQLVLHTSGIPNEFAVPADVALPLTAKQMTGYFKDRPLDFEPGEKWSYSNAGYVALGYIIEKASGQSYRDFLQQAIFTPLNMQDTGYAYNSNNLAIGYADRFTETPMGFSININPLLLSAAGNLYSSVEDLYKWAQALSTEKLVPRAVLDKMFTPRVKVGYGIPHNYGYGWMIGYEGNRPITMHTGALEGFTSVITIYPEEEIVIIVLTNQENKHVGTLHALISKIIFGDK